MNPWDIKEMANHERWDCWDPLSDELLQVGDNEGDQDSEGEEEDED